MTQDYDTHTTFHELKYH